MNRGIVLLVVLPVALLVGCGSSGAAPAGHPTAAPLAPIGVPPTAAPTAVNYAALRARLLAPLGALIVATRDRSPTATQHLATFNREAETILPVIAQDMSPNANRLHSVIVNVREAAPRRDVAALEAQRLTLLQVQ